MKRFLSWMLAPLAACGAAPPADVSEDTEVEPTCDYPAGAAEPMALDEVLSAYAWPEARRLDTSTEADIDLARVPCAADPDIDWSPFDVLLFVSIPAW